LTQKNVRDFAVGGDAETWERVIGVRRVPCCRGQAGKVGGTAKSRSAKSFLRLPGRQTEENLKRKRRWGHRRLN